MSTTDRLESLKVKHAKLDRKVSEEELRPMPDPSVLVSLKRQKLQIKDEMRALSTA
jgi:hypothetical protein